ncbi:MAG TPA: prepilin-type N-terminal cleavage/methylation domain-containing protein [Solirubrobacteraceae bacterium]
MTLLARSRERCARLRARTGAEDGFTLIEVLVAMVAGLIVSAAMGAIVVTSVHLGATTTDRVDANQQGRIALEKIVQQLDSACVANTAAPIISNGATGPVGNPALSDGTHIWFYTAVAPGQTVTDTATLNPSLVEIYLSNGSLKETAYPWAGGTAPAPANTNPWYFSWTTNVTSYTLLPNVAQVGSTAPIFQYYGYTSPVGTLSTTPYSTSPSLGATNASTTAQVSINFLALPTDDFNALNRGVQLTDSVVLRLTPASSQANAANAPCS